MSEESKRLGCAPSLNVRNRRAVNFTKANGNRACGGHLHFGIRKEILDVNRSVAMLDLILGNTCVLIDRDPGQKRRRKFYGRAGEYRLPSHGLEYRVLSNFWMRAYPLWSMVAQFGRLALTIANGNTYWGGGTYGNPCNEAFEWLNSRADWKLVDQAINENDAEKALVNYKIVREFFLMIPDARKEHERYFASQSMPISCTAVPWFDYFIEKGLDHWFPNDPFSNWNCLDDGHGCGWEAFLGTTVRDQYNAERKSNVAQPI